MTGTVPPATGETREGRGPTSVERRLSVLQAGQRLGALAHEREEEVQPGDLERPSDARGDVDDDAAAALVDRAAEDLAQLGRRVQVEVASDGDEVTLVVQGVLGEGEVGGH